MRSPSDWRGGSGVGSQRPAGPARSPWLEARPARAGSRLNASDPDACGQGSEKAPGGLRAAISRTPPARLPPPLEGGVSSVGAAPPLAANRRWCWTSAKAAAAAAGELGRGSSLLLEDVEVDERVDPLRQPPAPQRPRRGGGARMGGGAAESTADRLSTRSRAIAEIQPR